MGAPFILIGAYAPAAELYDPTTGLFTLTGNPPGGGSRGTLLASGLVLVTNDYTPVAQLYRP